MMLEHAMTLHFNLDKDSEVICPDDPRYNVFIRTHCFDFKAKNALNEYNALMDIMYVDEEKVRFYLLFVSFYLFA